jgi:hypothetical protein
VPGSARTWPSQATPGRSAAPTGVRQDRPHRPTNARAARRAGMLPESWIPTAHIAYARTQVRLRCALVGDRTSWNQSISQSCSRHSDV